MSGKILSINPAAAVTIVSGYSANGQVKDTLEFGAEGDTAKLFRKADLPEMVRNVLDE